ncbi:hypothetical protein [Rathayibacter tritici]|uniref:hypothetical protein n=1 Tax=Rathayibacter tritici TaxID=33888 RepID=UPI000A40D7FC|nr:hypothetical protein [Rathayibacter tritici]
MMVPNSNVAERDETSMSPLELHEAIGLRLSSSRSGYGNALASLATALGPEDLAANAAWFDHDTKGESSVHVRLITSTAILTLDHDFSFDGAPVARVIAWTSVHELNVIARSFDDPTAVNLWLEGPVGRIEFAGEASPAKLEACLLAVRKFLR